ncbi:50S ribosomal protein L3, partial [Candidatus Pacearchaeota archaeon]|nr:50S ribosomal protein L3 [Candidatus Pacearchaeota archaeon]
MPKKHRPRGGSLQFWPRSRAEKILPSVNWSNLSSEQNILGFIGYKVGMLSAIVRDNTQHSMTKGKQMIVPVTIIECPKLKILSIRFYKHKRVVKEILVSNEKELKRKIKVPKEIKKDVLDKINLADYDNITILVYTRRDKTPYISEIGLSGSLEQKFAKAKELVEKGISVNDVFSAGQIADIHAVTKGKGIVGPIKRFGIGKRQHKSEKGVRRPGSLGPWTPTRVSFRAPLMGQLGYFSRLQYNNKILDIANIKEKDINIKGGFPHYGIINSDYVIVKGSVQGVQKRPVILTVAARPTKKITKLNY